MKHRFSSYLKYITFSGDILALNLVWVLLYVTGHFVVSHETYEKSWPYFLIIVNVSWIVITLYTRPYREVRVYSESELIRDVFYIVFQHFLVTGTAIYMFNFRPIHKWGPPLVYLSLFLIILVWRLAQLYLLYRYRKRGNNYRKVVIIGYGTLSKHLKSFFETHPEFGYTLLGYFDDRVSSNDCLGKIEDVESYFTQEQIDEVYCCLPYMKYGEVKRIVDLCDDYYVKVKIITDFRAFFSKGLALDRYDRIPILNVSSIPLDDRRNQAVKRTFDFIFSLFFVIAIFSWLFPIVALIIKLDSSGPVIFKQKRTGRDNKDFYCLKFRTMKVNKESDTQQATKYDNRITKVGAFLRKSSLDELPQFLNVLVGDMSVVGPRPHMLKHTLEYSKQVGKFMMRHSVKPGVTGLAQSMGYRGETKTISDMRNRFKLDKFYIENWTFWLDIKIIFLTVVSLIRGSDKAY